MIYHINIIQLLREYEFSYLCSVKLTFTKT